MDQYLTEVLMHVEGLDDDIEVMKINVQVDHVHLVVMIPPRLSVAEEVQYMKSQSVGKTEGTIWVYTQSDEARWDMVARILRFDSWNERRYDTEICGIPGEGRLRSVETRAMMARSRRLLSAEVHWGCCQASGGIKVLLRVEKTIEEQL